MSTQIDSKSDKEKESSSSIKDVEAREAYDPEFEKRTMRKVDFRVLPLLAMVYSLSLIDRANLGVARTLGMGKDLGLDIGTRYTLISVVYFPTYIILELPSNIGLRSIGPRLWLSFITVAWGAVQLGEGFVPDYKMMALCRVLLGAMEAGYFPAMVYVMTTWYTRFEVQKRLAFFYLLAIFVSGFSSIFAYGVSKLGGQQGIAGWRWVFIVEGVITMFLGLLVFLYVVDFPDKNTFLTSEQTKFILRRIDEDRGDSVPDKITGAKVLEHLKDWKIWIYGLMFMTQTMPAYFVGFFINPILQGMGFSVANSLLLSAPCYAWATVIAFFWAVVADRTRMRALPMVPQILFEIIGLFVTAYAKSSGARYFGLFFILGGASGCIPGILAYSANNTISQSKRAVSSAVIIAFGGIGGIFATTVFRQQDYPKYVPGLWATIGCQFFMLILLAISTLYFREKNKQVRSGKISGVEGRPGFTYTL